MKRVMIWDPWLRLFHWLLTAALIVSFYTMKTEGFPLLFPVEWHARAGYVVLGLMLFRWLWGGMGSRHARFSSFVRPLSQAWRYACRLMRGRARVYAGHNPLGGWMVMLMLVSLTFQATSGLFLHDDILFEAPFYGVLGSETTKVLTVLHRVNGNILLALVGLHLLALVVHRVQGERLVGAMFSGRKTLPAEVPGETTQWSSWRAWAAAVLATALAVWLFSR